MPGPVFLHGDTMDLHTVAEDDAEFIARWRNDPDVRPWLPQTRPQTVAGTADELADPEGTDDSELRLIVCDDGEPLGAVGLARLDNAAGRAAIGAWFRPGAQGQRYGIDAVGRLVHCGFDDRRLNRTGAAARADNEASRAALESLGFVREGRHRDVHFLDGEYVDRVVYGLPESDRRSE